ncbi:unnamed protein product [Arctogadus glacialis]
MTRLRRYANATYVKAKDYLKKSLQCLTSDIQSEAEDPIRRKKRPNSRYLQEPAGRVQTTRGPPQHFFEGVDTDDEAPPPPRKTARQSVDVGPDINSEWLFGPSTTQRAQSTGSQRLELLHLDTVQPSHQLLHDMGISKVVELLSKVLEENKLMKAEITNLGSEVRALMRDGEAGSTRSCRFVHQAASEDNGGVSISRGCYERNPLRKTKDDLNIQSNWRAHCRRGRKKDVAEWPNK